MRDIVIRGKGVGKRYRLGEFEPYKALRDKLTNVLHAPVRVGASIFKCWQSAEIARQSNGSIWALKDVTFEIERGEVVGVIGRNGAGKTTLLKILSRISEPTEGYIEIRGRVGSLLEVGTGFHPELTGRENIYLNGAILGMRRAEIGRKFDAIVAFAQVEKFIDTPVKHYSTGMHVRLAFAVAAHLEPEILLVDEVLSVGDAAFQRRCLGKMSDVAKEGRTVLFVSHDMAAIQGLCRKVFLLERGHIAMAGGSQGVVGAYLASLPSLTTQPLAQRLDRQGNGRLKFTDVGFRSSDGVPIEVVQSGQTLEISLAYTSDFDTLNNVSVSVAIVALNGQRMLNLSNEMVGVYFDSIARTGRFSCLVERFPLTPGQYLLNVYCEVNGIIADWVQQAATLAVEAGDFFGTGRLPSRNLGGMLVAHTWAASNDGLSASHQFVTS